MKVRWVSMAVALGVTSCFSDPPSSLGGGEASSGEASGSSSTTSTGDTTSAGLTSSDTTGFADSSSGSSTTGACDLVAADPPRVPADVAVLVDTEVPTPAVVVALNTLSNQAQTNLAIIVPEAIAASVNVPADCFSGCTDDACPGNARRVIVPYDPAGSPYDTLATFERFDCVFRDPLPETSGPVSHLWFITHRPLLMPPLALASIVLDGDLPLRVHVSCPDCDDDLFNANSLLKQVVVDSGGTVSDYTELKEVETQLMELGEERLSCAWPTDDDPAELEFETRDGDGFLAERVSAFGACEPADEEGVFFPTDFGVALCPDTCRVVQGPPADSVVVSECI